MCYGRQYCALSPVKITHLLGIYFASCIQSSIQNSAGFLLALTAALCWFSICAMPVLLRFIARENLHLTLYNILRQSRLPCTGDAKPLGAGLSTQG